jgi:uncharacterized protein
LQSHQISGNVLAIDIVVRMSMGYIFEWDPGKTEINERKHRVTFDEASTVFADPLALLKLDPDRSLTEERYILLGMSGLMRLLVVAFAERPPNTRLISARLATRIERNQYEEKN